MFEKGSLESDIARNVLKYLDSLNDIKVKCELIKGVYHIKVIRKKTSGFGTIIKITIGG